MPFNSLQQLKDLKLVSATLQKLMQELGPPDTQFLSHLEKALEYRFKEDIPAAGQNTYLKDYEVPQIKLFDLLANHFPLVTESQLLVQQQLIAEARGHRHICILDLGTGRGVQMLRLLKALNDALLPLEVTLIGVELNEDALLHAKNQFRELARRMNFRLHFHGIHSSIENLDWKAVAEYIPENHSFLHVNASLTLHHIQQSAQRNRLFEELRILGPDLFTLIEPNAATFTDDFETRASNAAAHFYALYNYTAGLPLSPEEKRSLKTFFGNDFFDPIALPDPYRYEKLETGAEWISRARKTGFEPHIPDEELLMDNIPEIAIRVMPEEYINFSYRSVNLLSLILLH